MDKPVAVSTLYSPTLLATYSLIHLLLQLLIHLIIYYLFFQLLFQLRAITYLSASSL